MVDNSGVASDSRRGRLLFFLRDDKTGCKMAEYALNSGKVDALTATGADKVKANFREAVYLPRTTWS